MNNNTRCCAKCRTEQPASAFSKQPGGRDGLHPQCKACRHEYGVTWNNKNRERNRERRRAWEARNRVKRQGIMRKWRQELRAQVIAHYGGRCACCNEAALEFLTIDHIEGGGRAHRRLIRTSIYVWLKRHGFPQGYRVLCFNCNCAIGLYGSCPHQRA